MLKEFSNAEPNIQFTIVDVKNKNTTRRVSIVPAVFLNDKLYSFGDINKNDLRKKVYQLSRKY
jgi:alkyl hydroperoxide reductase subunit AhpF